MRAVVQRVSSARVTVGGEVTGAIGRGLLVLVGVTHEDAEDDAIVLADKVAGLRIFADADDKMNLALGDVGGACLIVSQFTLYGSARRGRRPSFTDAADPDRAERLVERVIERLAEIGVSTAGGRFGAMMQVELTNDGPVTLILETRRGRVV